MDAQSWTLLTPMNDNASSTRTVRVLMVEDDEGDFVIARECLRNAPGVVFDLLRARSLDEAVELLREDPADLVLLDLTLPDSHGWDTFTRLHMAAGNVPVVVLTGCDDENGALRALAEGAQDYVLKTQMNTETLARAARYALERHKAETALREYRDHLEQLVESRSRALEETNRKLRGANMSLSKAIEELKRHQQELIRHERFSALGQMASGIMQEFGNLLMPVIGYSEMLLDEPEILQQRDQALHLLQSIRDTALHATEGLQRMRYLCMPTDNEEWRLVDLNRLILQVIEDTRPRWMKDPAGKTSAIRVETDFDPITPVRGNEKQLSEALKCLVHNALDAMLGGGVLTFRTIANGEYVTVEVSDTGTGMPEDARRRCFDPFFTTKGAHATGLGLSIAHGIISSHGGNIEVASWVAQGTRVTMNLPVAAAAPATAQPAPLTPPNRELRILVVDDDTQVHRFLQAHLARSRHKVDTAETASGGIQKINSNRFDLVITDRSMPDQSGDEVALAAKRNNPGTTVVMLTGFGDLIKDGGALPEGVDRVVSKPVTLSEIDQIIMEVADSSWPAAGARSSP